MKLRRFLQELKRRNVYRFAAAYIVLAWLIIQVVTQTFPFLHIPNWVVTAVIVLLIAGFPLALVFSWLFDVTPEGLMRTDDLPPAAPAAAEAMPQRPVLMSPKPAKSVAVLPFENLSDDPANAYFADGVHDDVLTSLAKIADLKVISRTSVQQYKTGARNLRAIGDELGVAHVLEGTVRRAGNRIRVNVQLINADSDAHVWAETFDRELTDLFAIQTELADRITVALRANLSPRERANIDVRPTTNLQAYECYLSARDIFHWSGVGDAQESGERALPLLEEATRLDPQFALAFALLSRVHAELYWFGCDKSPQRIASSREAAERAQQLHPGLGEAHLALGFYHYYAARDYERAREELAAAFRITPNDSEVVGAIGVIDRRQARWEEALVHLETARELDPRNVSAIWNLVETYTFLGRYDDAERAVADGLTVAPNAHFFTLARASIALRRFGDVAPLRAALRAIPRDFDPGGAVSTTAVRVALFDGDYDEAERRLAGSSHNWCNDTALAGLAGALDGYTVPKSWYEGLICRGRGDAAGAEEAFRRARAAVEEDHLKWPDDAKTLMMLALVNAALGERDDAIRLARGAAKLLPVALDALDGGLIATNLAVIHAQTGEAELALHELERVVNTPGGPTPGLLRVEPEWSPLRDHPRFREIAAG
jgi:TolB-like protein/tetratricopeptide (TPR) repeat protein